MVCLDGIPCLSHVGQEACYSNAHAFAGDSVRLFGVSGGYQDGAITAINEHAVMLNTGAAVPYADIKSFDIIWRGEFFRAMM